MKQLLKVALNTLVFCSLIVLKANGQAKEKKFAMPNITGLTFKEATEILRKDKLEFGAVLYQSETEIPDSLIVYMQYPTPKSIRNKQIKVRIGDIVDIWLVNPRLMADTLSEPRKRTSLNISDL